MEDAPDMNFVLGIYVAGNGNNDSKIILSSEFLEWLNKKVASITAPEIPFQKRLVLHLKK
ncbi:MAG: hypothetical protein HY254_17860 [Burkholderiales bacterium]|nr:hypothetical protein [Burkholderiales bacterium]